MYTRSGAYGDVEDVFPEIYPGFAPDTSAATAEPDARKGLTASPITIVATSKSSMIVPALLGIGLVAAYLLLRR